MSESLPGPPWPIDPVEAPRHLVKINLGLLAASNQDPLEIDLVAAMLLQFLRSANGQFDKFAGRPVFRIEFIKRALAFPPGLHQTRILQQPQMRRNSRLAHPGNLLEFVYR